MGAERAVELEGHIIDSGTMQTCFGIIMDMGGSFEVEKFRIGRSKTEESYARLRVEADDSDHLKSIVHELHQNGANPSDPDDAQLEPAPADRVVPTGFYSTTNHPTQVKVDGAWIPVEDIVMDCAVVVERDGPEPRARTEVLNGIEAGDLVVTGEAGIHVRPPDRPRGQGDAFGFMRGVSRRSAPPRPRSTRSPPRSTRPDGRAVRSSRSVVRR